MNPVDRPGTGLIGSVSMRDIPGQDNELVSLQILPFPVQLYPAASFLTIDEKKLIASGWPVNIMMGSP
jgi:hypothetical protein